MAKRAKKKTGTRRKTGYTIALLIMGIVAIGFLVMLILLNALPTGLTMGLITVLLGLLLICAVLFTSKKKGVRITGIILAIFFMIVFSSATVFMGSTYAMLNNISGSGQGIQTGSSSKINVTEEPFNVYITGIDQWSKEKGLDLERSDVNMIVTVHPATHKIVLTSIPRDSYIPLHRTGTMDKLTHTGIYGVDETLSSVHDWLGLDFDYYVKMNFNACVDIVDAIGGIEVDSPKDFDSKISKYSYKKGINHLNGKQALYYARERAAFQGEDQIRVKNQLQVVEAVINKMTSSTVLLTSYSKIMDALGDEMETNMPTSDIQKLIKMQLSDMRDWDITSQRMTGTYDMATVASMNSKNEYSVLMVSAKSKQSCMETIRKVMNPTDEELRIAKNEKAQATLKSFLDKLLSRNKDEQDVNEIVPASSDYGTQYEKNDKYKGPLKWGEDIAEIEARDNVETESGKIIFYGSSSIRKWKTLEEDMAPLSVLNHGFGGSTVNDCVYYADRLIIPYKPKAIVFYAGTNDIAYGFSADTAYDRTMDFFDYIHEELPETKIYYIEQTRQPDRDEYWEDMKDLNARVEKYAKTDDLVTFIETSEILNTEYDEARPEYFVDDGKHFTAEGYAAWTKAIRPILIKELSE